MTWTTVAGRRDVLLVGSSSSPRVKARQIDINWVLVLVLLNSLLFWIVLVLGILAVV